jgi:hypothetical protein
MDPSTIDRQQRDAANNPSSYRVEYLNIPPRAIAQWGLSAKQDRPGNLCSQLSVCEGSRASLQLPPEVGE